MLGLIQAYKLLLSEPSKSKGTDQDVNYTRDKNRT